MIGRNSIKDLIGRMGCWCGFLFGAVIALHFQSAKEAARNAIRFASFQAVDHAVECISLYGV